jgi:hypothetical protein
MSRLDPFTQKRLERFFEDFRKKTGQLPTLKDLEDNRFNSEVIRLAIKAQLIEEFYVTLTNGTIVKGYKLSSIH